MSLGSKLQDAVEFTKRGFRPMEIMAGKFYRVRNGNKVYVGFVAPVYIEDFPIALNSQVQGFVLLREKGEWRFSSWYIDGKSCGAGTEDYKWDLLMEWKDA